MSAIDLLDIALDVLAWTIEWIFIFCGVILVLIMAKTLYDISTRIVDDAAPGIRRLSKRKGD